MGDLTLLKLMMLEGAQGMWFLTSCLVWPELRCEWVNIHN